MALVRNLRLHDPDLYARISEIRPVAPDAFAIFDRQLGTVVYDRAADLSSKWRELYAIAQSEKLDRGSVLYADLRFSDRIVLKPLKATAPPPHSELQGVIHAED